MAEEYTIDSYLGSQFQLRFLWQLLTEPEFAEQIFPFLIIDYWDDPDYKRYYIVLKEYYDTFGKVPNLQNKSIYNAIARYKIPNDSIDEEVLISITNKIKDWNERVLNKQLDFDGDIVQKQAFAFIKQGEYADMANFIINRVKKGQVSDDTLNLIEERIKKISDIGVEEDNGTDVFDDIDASLEKTFRNPIPTGIDELDRLMGGGLGAGEMGIVLAPTGVGKSTILTKFANEAFKYEKNVLQIIFEDVPDSIKRKHYAIWSNVKLSEMEDDHNKAIVKERVAEVYSEYSNNGKLIIKRFSQEDTTIPKIRKWIDRYRKKTGIRFDIVILDYLDCVEPHKKSVDQNQAELAIVKAFEAMAADYNIPCWTALQTNRSGMGTERVGHAQMGGNIKRAQKTHFLMAVAKTQEQKESGLANIDILKARFAQDGQFFEDVIFNNDEVRINFSGGNRRTRDDVPDTTDVDKFNENPNLKPISEVNSDAEIENEKEVADNTQYQDIDVDSEIEFLKSTPNISEEDKNSFNERLKQIAENQNVMKSSE